MADLEEEGYIYQPHTSAGRIPSIAGIRFYIDNLLEPLKIAKSEEKRLAASFAKQGLRGVARESAAYCQAACIVSYNNSDFYYTGFSQLFSQPEFMEIEHIHALGKVIDRIESVLPKLSHEISEQPRVYLGKGNPLGSECTAIFVSNRAVQKTVIGFLGPVRTNYARTIGVLKNVIRYLPTS